MNKCCRLLFSLECPDVQNLTTSAIELHWKLETKLKENGILSTTVAKNLIPLGYIFFSAS